MSAVNLETRLRLVRSAGDGEAGDREGWWAEPHAGQGLGGVPGGVGALALPGESCRPHAVAGTEEQLGGDCDGC